MTNRKKSRKKEGIAKHIDPSPQVDAQNFPVLGASNPNPTEAGKPRSIFGHRASTDDRSSRHQSKSKSKSKGKRKSDSEKENTTEDEKLEIDRAATLRRINAVPQPKTFKNGVSVLDMLNRSYTTMRTDYENDKYEPKNKLPEGFVEKYNMPKYPALKVERLISKFSDSTLFFIFYYQQDTYSQVLASEELVKRKW